MAQIVGLKKSFIIIFLVLVSFSLKANVLKTVIVKEQVHYTYTSQEEDKEVKLLNYRARFYHSKSGRFLATDIVKEQNGAYSYVSSNPVSYTDPTGMCEKCSSGKKKYQNNFIRKCENIEKKIETLLSSFQFKNSRVSKIMGTDNIKVNYHGLYWNREYMHKKESFQSYFFTLSNEKLHLTLNYVLVEDSKLIGEYVKESDIYFLKSNCLGTALGTNSDVKSGMFDENTLSPLIGQFRIENREWDYLVQEKVLTETNLADADFLISLDAHQRFLHIDLMKSTFVNDQGKIFISVFGKSGYNTPAFQDYDFPNEFFIKVGGFMFFK